MDRFVDTHDHALVVRFGSGEPVRRFADGFVGTETVLAFVDHPGDAAGPPAVAGFGGSVTDF